MSVAPSANQLPQARLSPELEMLLGRAEQRVTQGRASVAPPSDRLSPEAELEAAKAATQRPDGPSMTAMWRGYRGGIADAPDNPDTRVMRPMLESIAQSMSEVPPGFTPHPGP